MCVCVCVCVCSCTHVSKHRERERDRQTDRQTDRDRDRQRQTDRHIQRTTIKVSESFTRTTTWQLWPMLIVSPVKCVVPACTQERSTAGRQYVSGPQLLFQRSETRVVFLSCSVVILRWQDFPGKQAEFRHILVEGQLNKEDGK